MPEPMTRKSKCFTTDDDEEDEDEVGWVERWRDAAAVGMTIMGGLLCVFLF